ncbi:prolyl-tRNA synthetase associated domain-containing protein [Hyphococcus luteus]|uniref:DNA-binding protein n=1 Tax=Hyphococcus luteus TaxID=2058213 RepID=A0A2S7K742_9PROT|nr:prolyl-tRNA synthetase associated domain-containing protein [Marinicaulis flavus]PQA88344.1 DNA-binding protein [Marinicaulis flavus]
MAGDIQEGEAGESAEERAAGVPAGAADRAALFAFLDELGIAHRTVEHPAIFTVEEGRDYKKDMPGGHSKNLFLKDKKGKLTLAVALSETQVDLVGLGKRIGAKGRLSFGKPDLMTETLGVIPGAVTPFTLINDSAKALTQVILDEALLAHDPVWFHPLENTASTAISPGDLVSFVEACGFEPLILPLSGPFED